MAGFWNGHVHLTEPCWAGAASRPAAELDTSLADMFSGRGFTTVVDLASNPRDTMALKRRIESRWIAGPRIYTAGTAISPARGILFYVRESVSWYLRWALSAPWTAVGGRVAVTRQLRGGAEVQAVHRLLCDAPRVRLMSPRIARAVVRTARSRGALVFAHTRRPPYRRPIVSGRGGRPQPRSSMPCSSTQLTPRDATPTRCGRSGLGRMGWPVGREESPGE